MMKKKSESMLRSCTLVLLFVTAGLACLAQANWPSGMKPFAGRLAYSADGNYHDEDDIAADPFALMLLAKSGYRDRLVHFEYGNHIWYTRPSQLSRLEAATKTAAIRFGFDTTIFFNCIENRAATYHHLKEEILKSSEQNPLSILGAGPMHTIYQAMKLANDVNPEKLKYVTLVSHSPATGDSTSNNEHGRYDNAKGKDPIHKHDLPEKAKVWDDIVKDFPNVKFVVIRGQNGPPDVKLEAYDFCVGYPNIEDKWMKEFPDASVQWVWENMNAVFKNKADVSDAGMVWYWLTGGDQYGNYEKVKNALNNSFFVDENFNDDAPGTKPVQWKLSDNTSVMKMPGAIYRDHGIRINDASSTKPGHAVRTFAAKPADLVVDFDLISAGHREGEMSVTLETDREEPAVFIKATGNTIRFKKRAGGWEDIGVTADGKLLHLTIKVNAATGICSVVVDGRIVIRDADTSNEVKGKVSAVKFSTDAKFKGAAYIDNLKVYGL